MDKRELRKLAERVHGWLTHLEGEMLYDLASRCTNRGAIVEIGSWQGRSTIWLGYGSMKGSCQPIYAIDPHMSPHHDNMGCGSTLDLFNRNIQIAALEDVVVPIVKTSEAAAAEFDQPVEFIFIDGEHDYDSVRQDFALWYPKVIEGGIMAFHDTTRKIGPKRLVEERVFRSTNFRQIGIADSITYCQKVAQNSGADRLRNRLVLARKHPRDVVKRLMPKPARRLVSGILGRARQ